MQASRVVITLKIHMQQKTPKQQAGVWLDQRSATIISTSAEEGDGDFSIQGKVTADEEQRRGSEHAMNSAKHADTLKYFKSLSTALSKYDDILIFGPGKLQEQFHNFLNEDARFKNTKISLDTAEHLTEPQMIARVREYFK